jgi:hypothetical protein
MGLLLFNLRIRMPPQRHPGLKPPFFPIPFAKNTARKGFGKIAFLDTDGYLPQGHLGF